MRNNLDALFTITPPKGDTKEYGQKFLAKMKRFARTQTPEKRLVHVYLFMMQQIPVLEAEESLMDQWKDFYSKDERDRVKYRQKAVTLVLKRISKLSKDVVHDDGDIEMVFPTM